MQKKQITKTEYAVSKHVYVQFQFKVIKKANIKALKPMKCLPNILFNIDNMDLCLLPCFCILFER